MKTFLRNIIRPLTPSYRAERKEAVRQHQAMAEFYRAFIKQGDVCFDVGANRGNRTAVFLQLGAIVVAVEPQDSCIAELERTFGGNEKFKLITEALGAQPGEAELRIASESTISSMSAAWIEKVRASGRFENYDWQKSKTVRVTTLDELIRRFGVPSFIKIDVEGFEYEVLSGLHSAVHALSFEFVPEAIDNALNCLRRLSSFGTVECNYSLGESMQLVATEWVSAESLMHTLSNLSDKTVFGDVYVRFVSNGLRGGNS